MTSKFHFIIEGSVERTIDQLLAIASDNQNEKFMRDDDVSDKKPTQNIKPLVKPEMKSESSVRWKVKYSDQLWPDNDVVNLQPVLLPLEPHFLRLSTDPEYSEEFAVMLQNEEFLTQLRWFNNFNYPWSELIIPSFRFNQEFLSTLESEGRTDDRSFEDRLKHMGKVSRSVMNSFNCT